MDSRKERLGDIGEASGGRKVSTVSIGGRNARGMVVNGVSGGRERRNG